MRIESIELRLVRMPLKRPFETSFGVDVERDCLIIAVYSEGLVGWGECAADRTPGYSYETAGTAWHIISEFAVPALIGTALKAPADVRGHLSGIRGHPLAKAGLEMALWDLQGQRTGRSLSGMLGGERDRVPVGVSVGIQPSVNELLQTVEGYLADGYRRIKLKIKPGRDVEETRAVRVRFGGALLQVDANSAYTLESAGVLREMDALDLLLIEQPLAEDDLLDHARLQATLTTPLCLDESILSARHARQALEAKACRIINIKPGRVGGLCEAVAIHDLCWAAGVEVWCGGMLETGIGRAANLALASLPGFSLPGDISASDRYYMTDIAVPRFELNADSTITVPQGPGLGVTIDSAALDRYTLRHERIKGQHRHSPRGPTGD
jgi:O-succinylbenzoate synthase